MQCDAAITNGTYGTTCAILLAGKPVLTCPQNLERQLVARRVTEIGAGLMVPMENPELFSENINAVLNDTSLQQGAASFAKRYTGLDQAWQTEKMMRIINDLLPGTAAA